MIIYEAPLKSSGRYIKAVTLDDLDSTGENCDWMGALYIEQYDYKDKLCFLQMYAVLKETLDSDGVLFLEGLSCLFRSRVYELYEIFQDHEQKIVEAFKKHMGEIK